MILDVFCCSFILFQFNIINNCRMCEYGRLLIFHHCYLCCLNVFQKMDFFLTWLSVWHNLVNNITSALMQIEGSRNTRKGVWIGFLVWQLFRSQNKHKNNNNNNKDNDKNIFISVHRWLGYFQSTLPKWFSLIKGLNPIINLTTKQWQPISDFLRILTYSPP